MADQSKKGLTVEGVTEALKVAGGNMAAVGRAYGCTRQAVVKYVRHHPELREVIKDIQQADLDNAESALNRAVLKGEPWAICFILKCKGKKRGYIERTEIAHRGGIRVRDEMNHGERLARIMEMLYPAADSGKPAETAGERPSPTGQTPSG